MTLSRMLWSLFLSQIIDHLKFGAGVDA